MKIKIKVLEQHYESVYLHPTYKDVEIILEVPDGTNESALLNLILADEKLFYIEKIEENN